MGIRLVCEVLDHYRGPDTRKLWLLAWAEKANDGTRAGWPTRDVLSHRTGRSPSRVSHIADELVTEGVLKRDGGGNRSGPARFILMPLNAPVKGAPSTHPKPAIKGADPSPLPAETVSLPGTEVKGAPRTHPKPEVKGAESERKGAESAIKGADPSPLPAETVSLPLSIPSEVQPSEDLAVADAPVPTPQTILADFIDWVRGNGGDLTERTIGRLAAQIGKLVGERKPDKHIRQGLADWFVAGKNVSLLDDFVNAAMNAAARDRAAQNGGGRASPRQSQSTGAERAQAAIDAGRRVQAMIDGRNAS
jgi:hypothetical protein